MKKNLLTPSECEQNFFLLLFEANCDKWCCYFKNIPPPPPPPPSSSLPLPAFALPDDLPKWGWNFLVRRSTANGSVNEWNRNKEMLMIIMMTMMAMMKMKWGTFRCMHHVYACVMQTMVFMYEKWSCWIKHYGYNLCENFNIFFIAVSEVTNQNRCFLYIRQRHPQCSDTLLRAESW